MPGPWITDGDLTTAMAASLKIDAVELAADASWSVVLPESNLSAANDITSKLLGRGYTLAQIDAWDRRIEFNKDLGRYWAFVRGNIANTYSDILIKALDRRKDLDTVVVMTNGIIVLPGTINDENDPSTPDDDIDGGGSASGGRMNQDFFTYRLDREF